jgi:hypothetical protein
VIWFPHPALSLSLSLSLSLRKRERGDAVFHAAFHHAVSLVYGGRSTARYYYEFSHRFERIF